MKRGGAAFSEVHPLINPPALPAKGANHATSNVRVVVGGAAPPGGGGVLVIRTGTGGVDPR